jgi:hypothetical protein
MLEVNSNPLVTAYPIPGFPETWTGLMDLVMTVQVAPQELTQPLIPREFEFQGTSCSGWAAPGGGGGLRLTPPDTRQAGSWCSTSSWGGANTIRAPPSRKATCRT